jgi:hypothetical protein
MYLNNSYVYLIAKSFSSIFFLGLGSDCGVYFVLDDNSQIGSK